MCFKYENEYWQCFDFMQWGVDYGYEGNLVECLKEFGIKINKPQFFWTELNRLFEIMHENQIIIPMEEEMEEKTGEA